MLLNNWKNMLLMNVWHYCPKYACFPTYLWNEQIKTFFFFIFPTVLYCFSFSITQNQNFKYLFIYWKRGSTERKEETEKGRFIFVHWFSPQRATAANTRLSKKPGIWNSNGFSNLISRSPITGAVTCSFPRRISRKLDQSWRDQNLSTLRCDMGVTGSSLKICSITLALRITIWK